MPTVVVGSALDIVEACGVPRMLFVDFPLGNPCGKPFDRDMQRAIVEQALSLLEQATKPDMIVDAPFAWETHEWRDQYMYISDSDRERLRRAGEERRRERERRRVEGRVRS